MNDFVHMLWLGLYDCASVMLPFSKLKGGTPTSNQPRTTWTDKLLFA